MFKQQINNKSVVSAIERWWCARLNANRVFRMKSLTLIILNGFAGCVFFYTSSFSHVIIFPHHFVIIVNHVCRTDWMQFYERISIYSSNSRVVLFIKKKLFWQIISVLYKAGVYLIVWWQHDCKRKTHLVDKEYNKMK